MTTSKTRNRYSTEFKLELIKLIEEHGQSVTQIAAQYQVGVSTLNKWLHQYRQELKGHSPVSGKALTAEQQELQQLRKRVKQLELERDILKKASALLALDNLNVYR